MAAEFYGLGLGDPLPVSATQGLGTGDLLDLIAERLPQAESEEDEEAPVRLALIGRPNVGKSSLVNRLLGQERVIVDDRAGTTRDAIDTPIELDGRQVVLVDTAGLRRRPKVAGTVDYYAQLRSERAAERADVAIVVCDAQRGPDERGPARGRRGDAERLRHRDRPQQVGRDPHRPGGREGARDPEAAPAPAGAGGVGQERARARAAGGGGAGARRPLHGADPDRAAQPLPERPPDRQAAAGQARQAAEDVLHGPVRDRARRASRSR